MEMQEEECVSSETVTSDNSCVIYTAKMFHTMHPFDVARSKVLLYYNTSGRQKKHISNITYTWYKKYPWIIKTDNPIQ